MDEKELCPKCRQYFEITELIEHSETCQGNTLPTLTLNGQSEKKVISETVQKQIRLEQMESNKICTECGSFGRRENSSFCTECGGLLRDRTQKENAQKKKQDKKDGIFKEVKKDLERETKKEKKQAKGGKKK